MRKQVRDPFAVATAGAKGQGFTDFSEGSAGDEKRDEIAEAIKEGKAVLKRLNRLVKALD